MGTISSHSLVVGNASGISRCARKKPTHPGFVNCVTRFCRRSIEGGRRRSKDLTEGHCRAIRERAAASDIRKAASVAIRQRTNIEIPKRLRATINKCGDVAETEGSHTKFIKCLNKALEMAITLKWISAREASMMEEAGLMSTIGTFGEPSESTTTGETNEGKARQDPRSCRPETFDAHFPFSLLSAHSKPHPFTDRSCRRLYGRG